ncbi:hypothetical protein BJ875DRAFT_220118 [Amylocarpus encephaloides]|uniref:L-ornithine N(5)-monooxygenase n=1 Tax=Amylocarpus encephaloides TaxID=45428 RepID=A0A9P7YT26_9HELO|nr:hypothetical protein BJ875DRAFT_220118 [Amylocarpus encephaloides]
MEEIGSHVHDVIIIGAGPCGLALAARLCEDTPASLFTESEHQRYHWMKSSASSKRNSKPLRTSRRSHTAPDRLLHGPKVACPLDIAVLDANQSEWMGGWNNNFKRLGISHLRSPMFFHTDPRDRDGLLEFAYLEGQEEDIREITGVVGKDLSKHQRKQKASKSRKSQEIAYLDERDRKDFFRPSQSLFARQCKIIAERYNISDMVQNSKVTSIAYSDYRAKSGIFTLQTSTGVKRARTVAFAAGSAAPPSIPLEYSFVHQNFEHVSLALAPTSPDSALPVGLRRRIAQGRPSSVAVVGGGLTSAQVTNAAIGIGVSKVHHIIRGSMKVKHFDFDLPWVGKYKNFLLASFWSADTDEERLEMMKAARGGGSITPEYKKILSNLVKISKAEIHENTKITDAKWDDDTAKWTLETKPSTGGLEVDHIVFATGAPPVFHNIEALKPLSEMAPIKVVGGLPCITEDLMWNDDIPFFFTGHLAALKLGPAGPNLEGARQGAERIAGKLAEIFSEDRPDSGYGSQSGDQKSEVDMGRLGLGRDNQFDILASTSDSSQ